MDVIFLTLIVVLVVFLLLARGKTKRIEQIVAERDKQLVAATAEVARIQQAADSAVKNAQLLVEQQLVALKAETERIRTHYHGEAQEARAATDQALASALDQLAALTRYQQFVDEEGAATTMIADAVTEAAALKSEAAELLELAKGVAIRERSDASQRAKQIQAQADALLDHATRESARLVNEAHKKAQEIGGDAYTALREKEQLEQAILAIRNLIDGYGDRYVIPTRSMLDDLAADFGHTQAGHELVAAREQTKRMVEERHAAACDYVEANRRDTAIRFVIDAFNGRVDAILSRSKHDNHGTLAQEMRDSFALVNENGAAFRNARILPAYLDARLAELKWAVVVQELRLKEREEQRRIKEQIREEEKSRREYERAMEEAQREEGVIQRALAKAREEAEKATAGQRAVLETQILELNQKLIAAEAKNQRALSMAQQTKKGTVYVISNVGAFGEEVFKIGMTRRLEPQDRIKELGDASVPFEFDVHAMIACDDAPSLESRLHGEFDGHRMNRVNYRKEFFRMPLERLREVNSGCGVEASFTMLAEAREYRESVALAKMSPEERSHYQAPRES